MQIKALADPVIRRAVNWVADLFAAITGGTQIPQALADLPADMIQPDPPARGWTGRVADLYEQQFVMAASARQHCGPAIEYSALLLQPYDVRIERDGLREAAYLEDDMAEFGHSILLQVVS